MVNRFYQRKKGMKQKPNPPETNIMTSNPLHGSSERPLTLFGLSGYACTLGTQRNPHILEGLTHKMVGLSTPPKKEVDCWVQTVY